MQVEGVDFILKGINGSTSLSDLLFPPVAAIGGSRLNSSPASLTANFL